jgi:hypothetical protein
MHRIGGATDAIMQSIIPRGVTPARRHARWMRTAASKSTMASTVMSSATRRSTGLAVARSYST